MCGDERLQLADQIRIRAEGEIGVDSLLQRREAHVVQPSNLGLRERGKGQILQRRPPEQRERFAQGRCGSLQIAGRKRPPTLIHQGLEPLQIHSPSSTCSRYPGGRVSSRSGAPSRCSTFRSRET